MLRWIPKYYTPSQKGVYKIKITDLMTKWLEYYRIG